MNERVKGTIRKWKDENGYGFAAVNGGKDIFVHITAVTNAPEGQNALEVGQAVEFEVIPGRKEGQFQAANVVVL